MATISNIRDSQLQESSEIIIKHQQQKYAIDYKYHYFWHRSTSSLCKRQYRKIVSLTLIFSIKSVIQRSNITLLKARRCAQKDF